MHITLSEPLTTLALGLLLIAMGRAMRAVNLRYTHTGRQTNH